MANDLATMRTRLATALRDAAHSTWASSEKDELITSAVEDLHPHITRPLDPTSTTIAMTLDTFFYSLPAGVLYVSRIDHVGADGTEYGPVAGNAWEIVGDPMTGAGKLHLSPQVERVGDILRLNAYGKYDVTTNLVPDRYVPLILADARAEAVRRVLADRERFLSWLSRNQTQNVSVNEMLQMLREAESESDRLRRSFRIWQKPVEGRV